MPAALALAALLAVSACSGAAGGGTSGSGSGTILTVGGQAVGMTRVFNPFLPTSALNLAGNAVTTGSSSGFIYEPLAQVNYVKSNDVIPWLATSWTWSNSDKTLTWHLRQGVKWTDGQPFTSADVVYTYQLMAKYPALNLNGVTFTSVSAPNADTVVLTFASPQEQNFDIYASQIIVPKHIWSKISNPTTWADPNPVGTGPFTLSSFSPQSYLLVKNPHYWQPGKPAIGGLRFVAFSDNETLDNAIAAGQIDWAADYLPNAQTTYLNRSSDNNYWVPAAGSDGLIPNLDTFPLSDLAVRKAISVGIDRSAIAAARNSPPATNVTGLPVPSFNSLIAPQYKRRRLPAEHRRGEVDPDRGRLDDGTRRLLREERPPAHLLPDVPLVVHGHRRRGLGADRGAQGDRHQHDDRHGPRERDQHPHRAWPVPVHDGIPGLVHADRLVLLLRADGPAVLRAQRQEHHRPTRTSSGSTTRPPSRCSRNIRRPAPRSSSRSSHSSKASGPASCR